MPHLQNLTGVPLFFCRQILFLVSTFCLIVSNLFTFNMERSFTVQNLSAIIPIVGVQIDIHSSVTLIGTVCDVFVIHCTYPTSQMKYCNEQRWKQYFGGTGNKTLCTIIKGSNHHAILRLYVILFSCVRSNFTNRMIN